MATKTIYYDGFGGCQGENPAPPAKKRAYQMKDVGGGVKYICFRPDDVNGGRVIERVAKVSEGGITTTTITQAYGDWENPGGIATWYPPNQAIPVEIEEA